MSETLTVAHPARVDLSFPHAQTTIMTAPALQGDGQTAQPFDQLIVSWNGQTPGAGALEVDVRVASPAGEWSQWFSFGCWSTRASRQSLDDQEDSFGWMSTDTLLLNAPSHAYEYRVTLHDQASISLLALTTSLKEQHQAFLGEAGNPAQWGRRLDVPLRSQMVHEGGEGWCSPTALSMLLSYHGIEVSVPDAAAGTFDRVYEGTGNWPFNTAYAATFGLSAFVTRLPSLRVAESFLGAEVPLALSLGWKVGELDNAPLPSSGGHLVVLVGFDEQGQPVVNDPAAASDADVQRVYDRQQFEKQWLSRSGGMAYILLPSVQTLDSVEM
ncbi:peptidase C39 family protein [Deinococcus ruber]|uniref:Peptidase C39 n=1 Tax=Deinococcus ruber TaxID=1848197 RepID=A0A918FCF2_9DEIO|nr:peptidase C39 family protein [Deinococcus ruber]GGR30447.1 peptidase C39 [Deinococcus ruber]